MRLYGYFEIQDIKTVDDRTLYEIFYELNNQSQPISKLDLLIQNRYSSKYALKQVIVRGLYRDKKLPAY